MTKTYNFMGCKYAELEGTVKAGSIVVRKKMGKVLQFEAVTVMEDFSSDDIMLKVLRENGEITKVISSSIIFYGQECEEASRLNMWSNFMADQKAKLMEVFSKVNPHFHTSLDVYENDKAFSLDLHLVEEVPTALGDIEINSLLDIMLIVDRETAFSKVFSEAIKFPNYQQDMTAMAQVEEIVDRYIQHGQATVRMMEYKGEMIPTETSIVF